MRGRLKQIRRIGIVPAGGAVIGGAAVAIGGKAAEEIVSDPFCFGIATLLAVEQFAPKKLKIPLIFALMGASKVINKCDKRISGYKRSRKNAASVEEIKRDKYLLDIACEFNLDWLVPEREGVFVDFKNGNVSEDWFKNFCLEDDGSLDEKTDLSIIEFLTGLNEVSSFFYGLAVSDGVEANSRESAFFTFRLLDRLSFLVENKAIGLGEALAFITAMREFVNYTFMRGHQYQIYSDSVLAVCLGSNDTFSLRFGDSKIEKINDNEGSVLAVMDNNCELAAEIFYTQPIEDEFWVVEKRIKECLDTLSETVESNQSFFKRGKSNKLLQDISDIKKFIVDSFHGDIDIKEVSVLKSQIIAIKNKISYEYFDVEKNRNAKVKNKNAFFEVFQSIESILSSFERYMQNCEINDSEYYDEVKEDISIASEMDEIEQFILSKKKSHEITMSKVIEVETQKSNLRTGASCGQDLEQIGRDEFGLFVHFLLQEYKETNKSIHDLLVNINSDPSGDYSAQKSRIFGLITEFKVKVNEWKLGNASITGEVAAMQETFCILLDGYADKIKKEIVRLESYYAELNQVSDVLAELEREVPAYESDNEPVKWWQIVFSDGLSRETIKKIDKARNDVLEAGTNLQVVLAANKPFLVRSSLENLDEQKGGSIVFDENKFDEYFVALNTRFEAYNKLQELLNSKQALIKDKQTGFWGFLWRFSYLFSQERSRINTEIKKLNREIDQSNKIINECKSVHAELLTGIRNYRKRMAIVSCEMPSYVLYPESTDQQVKSELPPAYKSFQQVVMLEPRHQNVEPLVPDEEDNYVEPNLGGVLNGQALFAAPSVPQQDLELEAGILSAKKAKEIELSSRRGGVLQRVFG